MQVSRIESKFEAHSQVKLEIKHNLLFSILHNWEIPKFDLPEAIDSHVPTFQPYSRYFALPYPAT